jgi:uncharacterized membrane protein
LDFGQIASTVMQSIGLAVIVVGTVIAGVRYGYRLVSRIPNSYEKVRAELGRAILLGLEVLVAADIIETLLVDPTMEAVGVLGLLVLVRTLLSWALSIEIDGFVPWKKWQYRRAEKAADQMPAIPATRSR